MYYRFGIWCVCYMWRTYDFRPATFQVLTGHMWLLESTALDRAKMLLLLKHLLLGTLFIESFTASCTLIFQSVTPLQHMVVTSVYLNSLVPGTLLSYPTSTRETGKLALTSPVFFAIAGGHLTLFQSMRGQKNYD